MKAMSSRSARRLLNSGRRVVSSGHCSLDTVRQTRELLQSPDMAAEMVWHNYEVARRHYSYANPEKLLATIVGYCVGA